MAQTRPANEKRFFLRSRAGKLELILQQARLGWQKRNKFSNVPDPKKNHQKYICYVLVIGPVLESLKSKRSGPKSEKNWSGKCPGQDFVFWSGLGSKLSLLFWAGANFLSLVRAGPGRAKSTRTDLYWKVTRTKKKE